LKPIEANRKQKKPKEAKRNQLKLIEAN